MAYPVQGSFVSEAFTTANNATLSALPSHATNDLIIVVATQDTGTGTLSTATAGWTRHGTKTGNPAGGAFQQVFYKIAASGSETSPQIDSSISDDWVLAAFVVKDADTSTPVDSAGAQTDWNNVASAASGALTTGTNGCLVLYFWGSDGGTNFRVDLDDALMIGQENIGSNVAVGCCYRQQQTAGAIAATMNFSSASEGGTSWAIAIKNAVGGRLAPDVRITSTPVKFYGNFGVAAGALTIYAPEAVGNQFAGGFTAAALDGISVTANAPTVATSALSMNIAAIGTSTSIASAENTAGLWVGGWHAVSSTDMTGQLYTGELGMSQPGTSLRIGSGGVLVGFTDGTNYEMFRVMNKSKGWAGTLGYRFYLVPDVTTPTYSRGTLDWTAITGICYVWHRKGSSGTSDYVYVANAFLIDLMILTGGVAGNKITPRDLFLASENNAYIDLARLQGSAQALAFVPLQIGDGGSNTTILEAAAVSMEFPRGWSASSVSNWQTLWNVPAGYAGVTLYAGASDTLDFSASVIASDTLQPFTIHASSSTSATYSFAGTSFVGWTVTWKTGIVCANATFKQCATVAFKAADPDTVSISDTTAGATEAACSFDANGGSMTTCTIDVTGTSAGYHIELGTAVTAITLTDVTFTGAPGTDKVHVLKTTGTVTITIAGTTTLVAGDVTSEGASVVIQSDPVTQAVTISGLVAGSRVQIYDTSLSGSPPAATELFNDIVAGTSTTWTDSVAAVATRAIRVRIAKYASGVGSPPAGSTAYEFIEANIGTCGITSGTETVSYLANQVADAIYNANGVDGADVTGITFTDAATDLVNCNIPGGSVSCQQIYAAFVYWMFTAAGIADDIAYVDAPDSANLLFTSMKVRNTDTNPLTITGGWIRDATSLTIADAIDTAGSTGNIFPLPDHVVNNVVTVGGVNVITGDIADIPAAPSAATVATTLLDLANGIETDKTFRQAMRIILAAMAGKTNGFVPGSVGTGNIRDVNDAKNRVVAVYDANGNRTAVTLDAT